MLKDTSLIQNWLYLCGFTYGMYYLVAFVGESRIPGSKSYQVPIWADQSRAFMPGVFFLMAFVACGLFMDARSSFAWRESFALNVLFLVAALVLMGLARWASVVRHRDLGMPLSRLPPSAYAVSLYRCIVVPILVARSALPGYVFNYSLVNGIVFYGGLLALVCWALCAAADSVSQNYPSKRLYPKHWRPIWKTLRDR